VVGVVVFSAIAGISPLVSARSEEGHTKLEGTGVPIEHLFVNPSCGLVTHPTRLCATES
jgi:hypothetical protein